MPSQLTEPDSRARSRRGRGDHRRVKPGPPDPSDRAAEQQASSACHLVLGLVGHPGRREQSERHGQQQQQRGDVSLHGGQIGEPGRGRQLGEPGIGLEEVGQRDGQQPDQQEVRGQRQRPADEGRQRSGAPRSPYPATAAGAAAVGPADRAAGRSRRRAEPAITHAAAPTATAPGPGRRAAPTGRSAYGGAERQQPERRHPGAPTPATRPRPPPCARAVRRRADRPPIPSRPAARRAADRWRRRPRRTAGRRARCPWRTIAAPRRPAPVSHHGQPERQPEDDHDGRDHEQMGQQAEPEPERPDQGEPGSAGVLLSAGQPGRRGERPGRGGHGREGAGPPDREAAGDGRARAARRTALGSPGCRRAPPGSERPPGTANVTRVLPGRRSPSVRRSARSGRLRRGGPAAGRVRRERRRPGAARPGSPQPIGGRDDGGHVSSRP